MKRKTKRSSARPTPLPDQMQELEGYHAYLDGAEFSLLTEEINQPLPTVIRLNSLKTDLSFPAFLMNKYSWKLEVLPFCSTGFRVLDGNAAEVSGSLEHKLGMFYIQEAASMLPVELFKLNHDQDELSLDLAASPGGKTTHLLSRLNDRGLVIANDSSQGRIQALRIVLQNWGSVGCAITRFPGESFGSWFPNLFDRALLDAPCSMQGLRTTDSHAVRPVTIKESSQLSKRQFALLTSALQAVKVGGEVVYSTCTLLPEEDEGVIDAVLKKFGSKVKLLDGQQYLPKPAPGISRSKEVQYIPGMEKTIRLWPHRYHTAGFFACILQKTAEIDLSKTTPPAHDMQKAGFFEISKTETAVFCRQFADAFGYDLESYLEHENRCLVRHFEKIFLFPSMLLERLHSLPVQSAGLLLGEQTPDGFLPSHEWVSRFGKLCQRNILILEKDFARNWINGENLELLSSTHSGNNKYLVVLNEDRQAIGRGKMTSTGLKNLLPRRLL